MQPPPPEIDIGDIVKMRKKHPCGSTEWKIVRVGVDVGLVCCTCERRILLPRGKFNKQVKGLVSKASPPKPTST